MIEIFSKPGCGKCEAAKSKLQKMGLQYTERSAEYYTTLHEGWRDDGSADVMALYQVENTLPIFKIDADYLNYPQAMKRLKPVARPAAAAPKEAELAVA